MTFYVTFGQKYRDELHPYFGHPDGWTEVQAEDMESAREKVFNRYGRQWAWMYDSSQFDSIRHLHPRGRIETII